MTTRSERFKGKPLNCSVCKLPLETRSGQGRRRLALMEDGLTLCDVCAPAGNHIHLRIQR